MWTRLALRSDDGQVLQARVPLALKLTAVCFVPDLSVPTPHARGLLPATVTLNDAVFNVGRSSLLVAGVARSVEERSDDHRVPELARGRVAENSLTSEARITSQPYGGRPT